MCFINKKDVLYGILNKLPKNNTIINNFIKAFWIINNNAYKKIICTVSGGSDSDVMMDICVRCDVDNKIDYVWFDTGLEYQATKDHLKYLEEKYGVNIIRYRAIKPIPLSCKQYGQPFMSKQVSEFIQRLQRHKFKFEDKSFDELYAEYPKCKSALQWWCNRNKTYSFNISGHKYLKEFLIANPPTFNISNKCCKYAKKDVVHKAILENGYDLNIYGVRKAEGGAKSNDAPGLPSNFIVVEEADASMGWTGTVVDRDTNVVYLYSIYTTNVFPEVELVPLYNPDGSLKVCQYD